MNNLKTRSLMIGITTLIAIGSANAAQSDYYVKIGDIQGESTEATKDAQRSRGDTTLGDVVVVKQHNKASHLMLNPQPVPPKSKTGRHATGSPVMLNPQPVPPEPKTGLLLPAVQN